MRKRIAALIAACVLLLPIPGHAQVGDRLLPLATLYDLDATEYTYCVTLGERGTADGDWIAVRKFLTTSGSSTTITGLVAADDPFTVVAAGDEISFIVQGVEQQRVIVTNADDDTITVNAAIDLTLGTPDGGYYWKYRTRSCGTAATSGWFGVNRYNFASVTLAVAQISVTGQIEFKVQCRHSGTENQPVDVYAEGMANYRSGGYNAVQVDNDTIIIHNGFSIFDQCRVGMLIDSADDGSDTGADAEQVTTKAKLLVRAQ